MIDDRFTVRFRKGAFLEELLKLPREKAEPLADFVRRAGFELQKGPGEKPSGEVPDDRVLTERQVRYAIQEIESYIEPLKVKFEGGNILVTRGKEVTFLNRLQRAAVQKQRIAQALWDFLLGPSWRGATGRSPSPIGDTSMMEKKQLWIRRRNQLYFAVDGGTTTFAVINELLTARSIPIKVRVDEREGDDSKNIRLVEPVLLTNSIPIVQAVTEHENHRWSFIVELIGGVVRPGRNCLTGEMTNACLRSYNGLGLICNLDLVVIGATGVFVRSDGLAVATCDDPEEANLKNKLLELAGGNERTGEDGGFRVIVFHSAKLLFPEARCSFAAITRTMVDLVVVDRGKDEIEESVVMKFVATAEKAGVAVLVVDGASD